MKRRTKKDRRGSDRGKTVKNILKSMLVTEAAALAAVLGLTLVILSALYLSMQSFRQNSIRVMQMVEEMQYNNAMIQNANYKLMLSTDKEKAVTYQQEIDTGDMQLQKQLKDLKKIYPQASDTVTQIQGLLQEALTYRWQAVSLSAAGKGTEAVAVLEDSYMPIINEVNGKLEDLSGMAERKVDTSIELMKDAIFVFSGAGILFVTVLVLGIRRKQSRIIHMITEPLALLEQAMGEMSEGNLSFDIAYKEKNEFGLLAEQFMLTGAQLEKYVQNISTVLGQVADKNFTVTVEENYKGMFRPIRSSLEHIIASMDEVVYSVGDTAKVLAEESGEMKEIAHVLTVSTRHQEKAVHIFEQDMKMVYQKADENYRAAESMKECTDQSEAIVRQGGEYMENLVVMVGNIEHTFSDVSEILAMIRDISEQIALLTLNASIEAARAGEAGRGFAVLAQQMRLLVEQTSEATERTEALLNAGKQAIAEGRAVVSSVENNFGRIQNISNKMEKNALLLKDVSVEQKNVITESNKQVTTIQNIVIAYVEMTERIQRQSEELNTQIEVLTKQIEEFQVRERQEETSNETAFVL